MQAPYYRGKYSTELTQTKRLNGSAKPRICTTFAFDADHDHGPRKVGALVCDLRLDILLGVRVAGLM
jgi:hypothetical protein